MSSQTAPRKRVTIHELRRMKGAGEKIAVVTAYDATSARLVDRGGVDVVLVGDSLGMVLQGHDSTLPVTLDQMIYHSASVRRGLARAGSRAHLVGDMPFGSYQASADEAVKNAMRLVAEGGVEAVKLEGGAEYAEVIARIVRAGIPVMGHIGLTPQSVHKMGGYVVQGREATRPSGSSRTPTRSRPPAATRWCWSASRRSWPGSSPRSSASPPSASAPGSTPTARCSSTTTSSASRPSSSPSS